MLFYISFKFSFNLLILFFYNFFNSCFIFLIYVLMSVIKFLKKKFFIFTYCCEIDSVIEINTVVEESSTVLNKAPIFFFIFSILFSLLLISNSGTGVGGMCSTLVSPTIFSSSLEQQPISALNSVSGSSNVSSLVLDTSLVTEKISISNFLSAVDLPTKQNQSITYVDQLTNTSITVVLESIEKVPFKDPTVYSKADLFIMAQTSGVENTELAYNFLVGLTL